ncbi:MAG: FAD-binding protein [Mycobacterium sp.]|nr:FAD-binding protein [Mycobacterium sp.]
MEGTTMTPDVQIELLTGLGHLAPVLAGWHHAEWGHLYADDVWNFRVAVREFETMAEPGSHDRTWVAFDGPARTAEAVIGSVSLAVTDDLPGFEHLTPWLASMFVAPAARGRGVSRALTEALMAGALADGHEVVHLFTAGQQQFWADRGWSVVAGVHSQGQPAVVMARSTHPRAARRAVGTHWCSDPDHGGAYSYLRLGGTPAHRRRLSEQILPGLWFAGEATSADFPATMHGAWFTGERAAEQVVADLARRRVAVVGAGLAGLAAARRLQAAGCSVMVFESKTAAGGRIAADWSTGVPVPLGAGWLHGIEGHPLRELVSFIADDWSRPAYFAAGSGRLAVEQVEAVNAAEKMLFDRFEAAAPGVSVASALDQTLTTADLTPPVRDALKSSITAVCEGLFGAPMDDLAANGGFEDYELPGGDHLVTSDLGALAEHLADGLDLRRGHRVGALGMRGAGWVVDGEVEVDAVVVAVPIGALAAGRIAFEPGLPADVVDAIASIGVGPITKVVALFDEVWWPPDRPVHLIGTAAIGTVIDISAVTGRPTLAGVAVGQAARRIEHLGEHELCRLLDRELATAGLTDWDVDATTGSPASRP